MQDEGKREDKRFYDSTLWQKTRRMVLMQDPYCAQCRRENRVTLATMVDHVHRIAAGGDKLSRDNLEGLCSRCHAVKRQRESQEVNHPRGWDGV
jgi:5-methylcytosine-specific restriction protein A